MRPRLLTLAVAMLGALLCNAAPKETPRAAPAPTVIPQVVKILPHDPSAFTQGLLYRDGSLYESTGLHGKSSLRRIDARSGEVRVNLPVPGAFAEGIAVLGKSLVQLTWREEVALVYSLEGLRQTGTIRYKGEGWGLTSDSSVFYMSNGSDTLYVRNSAFDVVRRVAVSTAGTPLRNLNELEFVNGSILANVWYSDYIFRISPADGSVRAVVDCSGIVKQERPASDSDVLNGIAYDSESRLFYITGKNWRHIYVARIPGLS